MPDPNPQRPIFVVGVARSGTTLVSALLNAHPGIAIAPESHYLSYWIKAYSHLNVARPADLRIFWSAFTSNNHFQRWNVSADAVFARIERQPVASFHVIFAALLEEYRLARSKSRVGEKTPAHDQHVERLLEWFPDARILYVLRDPRAVVASLLHAPWTQPVADVHARRWRQSVTGNRSSQDPRVTTVRYEDLVARPTETLGAVCEFLGEPFRAEMLALERTDGPLSGEDAWKEAARGPIDPGFATRWRENLSEADVAIVEHVAGSLMTELGYAREGRRLSVAERARLFVQASLRRVRSRFTPLRPPWSLEPR